MSQTSLRSESTFRNIYEDLIARGKRVSPRGQKSIEIENYTYNLPPFVRFTSFASRGFKLDYVKREFLWYLKGDKFDTSIADFAKMWGNLINRDGSINSNYGQYIFRDTPVSQFDNVVNQLKNDKDSRRASISILSRDHLLSDTNDVPCTYALNFRIREDFLNMSVRMRSQDSVYGMANDAPAFSFTHEMVLNALREFYPELKYGNYHHSADSFHVYERHFELLEKITGSTIENRENFLSLPTTKKDPYEEISCPPISGPAEVKFLRACQFEAIPQEFEFTRWLTS
jgi:thymidylate synthase